MSKSDGPIWITEADVVSLLDMGEAIEALRGGLAMLAAGEASNMVKTYAPFGESSNLHALGGTMEGAGLVGTKTWAHTPGGANPLLILFDSRTGALRAVLEAFALGQLRTAAVSGVATDVLASPAADEMAIAGTGKQALAQVAAVAAVRQLRSVRVFGRDVGRRDAFVERVEKELDIEASGHSDVGEAVGGAPVVTLVTRAATPFLTSDMLAPGAHVNAVGAISPERIEFEPDLLSRCTVVAADNVEQTRELSQEFRTFYGDDEQRWQAVRRLSDLLEERRPADADVTLFKAMGMGVSDLSLGRFCYELATVNGLGRPMEAPRRLQPDLRAPGGVPRIGYV